MKSHVEATSAASKMILWLTRNVPDLNRVRILDLPASGWSRHKGPLPRVSEFLHHLSLRGRACLWCVAADDCGGQQLGPSGCLRDLMFVAALEQVIRR